MQMLAVRVLVAQLNELTSISVLFSSYSISLSLLKNQSCTTNAKPLMNQAAVENGSPLMKQTGKDELNTSGRKLLIEEGNKGKTQYRHDKELIYYWLKSKESSG